MSWNKHETVSYARSHAHQKSQGYCARAVAVIDALSGPNQYGHVCIYDGSGTWYSDFVQRSLYPGPQYRKTQPAVTLYRHN